MPVLPRTAVVIVHGIGEQRPFETLRGFVGGENASTGLLDASDIEHCFVNPDALTGTTYSRRLSLDHTHKVESLPLTAGVKRRRHSRTTHFYEYFWAHRFRDTGWRHLGATLSRLIRTRRDLLEPGSVSGPIGFRFTMLRLLALAMIAATGVATAFSVGAATSPGGDGWLLWAIVAFATSAVAVFLGNWLGLLSSARAALGVPLFAIGGAVAGFLYTVPEHPMRSLILVSAVAFALAAVVAWVFRVSGWRIVLILAAAVAFIVGSWGDWKGVEGLGEILQAVLSTVLAVAPALLGGFALRAFGDAARYLSNTPDDIGEREAIRTGLVDLLRNLEAEEDPVTGRKAYERVVLVGHSLGGVIAYDALTALWVQTYRAIEFPDREQDPRRYPLMTAVGALEDQRFARASLAKNRAEAAIEALSDDEIELWQRRQATLQAALRADARWENGAVEATQQRWIVSDFVTLGTPLSHADVLFADGIAQLRKAAGDRLLPTCPPSRQSVAPAAAEHPYRFREWLGKRYSTRLHHAAAFAATTWTNVYFTHDLVGGALAPRFGGAIRDVALSGRPPRLWAFLRVFPHTSYWGGEQDSPNREGTAESIRVLRSIAIRQRPVLMVTGDAEQVSALRERLADSYVGEGPVAQDDDVFELRVLRKSEDKKPRRAWTWLGFDPWFAVADYEGISAVVTELGMSAVLADTAEPQRSKPSSGSPDVPGDPVVEPEEEAAN